ncbi:MAG: hypothetical protein ACK4ZS_06050, partial [Sulfurimicrobium sp.]
MLFCYDTKMGGYGSGRQNGRPVAESCLFIDLAWMIRNGRAVPSEYRHGGLSWSCGDQPSGDIRYTCDMRELEDAWLELRFFVRQRSTGASRDHAQRIRLSCTRPNYGGRRWWMHCPQTGQRVGKLFVPPGGELFASRQAWRLGYRSQRSSERDKPFDALFRLQKKLGGRQGWEAGLAPRPKGMWRRTYDRHWERYFELDDACAATMASLFLTLGKA